MIIFRAKLENGSDPIEQIFLLGSSIVTFRTGFDTIRLVGNRVDSIVELGEKNFMDSCQTSLCRQRAYLIMRYGVFVCTFVLRLVGYTLRLHGYRNLPRLDHWPPSALSLCAGTKETSGDFRKLRTALSSLVSLAITVKIKLLCDASFSSSKGTRLFDVANRT